MVEWMLPQRRSGIDVEGVAPSPDQKARLDRLDEPHGGLAGHRAAWDGWRCHRERERSKGNKGEDREDAPGTVHGPLRKLYPNAVRNPERHDPRPHIPGGRPRAP